jgi:outer membrane usher protein FimD/PapC
VPKRLAAAALMTVLCLPRAAPCGERRVSPIRLELGRQARSGVVTVINDSEERLQVQMRATEWTQDAEGKDRDEETGDLFAASGDLGAGVNLGGVSFSKVFRIDPYFYRYPLASLSGQLSMPSEVEVYLDGMRVRTERLSPGEFELRNLSHSAGASVVTVVVRDPFGTERRIDYPFYFTDALLRKGLHEYSYNAGFLRHEFGAASNRYGDAAFSAFHRYGLTDAVTIGGRSEGGGGAVNIGPEAAVRLGAFGVLSASFSVSRDDRRGEGVAAVVRHVYQGRTLSARMFAAGFSREYAVIGEENGTARRKIEAGAGFGYGTRRTGSISLDGSVAREYGGPERRTASATPFFQYNGRYGIYTAVYRADVADGGDTVETTRVTASGGIAYVGGSLGLSRPVADSFGLVRVGGLEGVRVYRNGQEIGRTDGAGKVFVPDLSSYYENQVSIDDRDVPMEYSIPEVRRLRVAAAAERIRDLLRREAVPGGHGDDLHDRGGGDRPRRVLRSDDDDAGRGDLLPHREGRRVLHRGRAAGTAPGHAPAPRAAVRVRRRDPGVRRHAHRPGRSCV